MIRDFTPAELKRHTLSQRTSFGFGNSTQLPPDQNTTPPQAEKSNEPAGEDISSGTVQLQQPECET